MTEGPGSDYPGQHENPYQAYPPGPGYAPYGGGYGKPPAPKPGIIPLRPLGVGEILDGSFTAMKWNPKAVLGPSAIVATIAGVLLAVISYFVERDVYSHVTVSQSGTTSLSASQVGSLAITIGVLFGAVAIVTFFANAILTGILTLAVGNGVLGRKETLASAWNATRPRLGALIAALILAPLFVFLGLVVAIAIAVGIGLALGAGAHLVPVGVLVGIALGGTALVFAIIVGIRWSLIVPVVVLERVGPVKAMGRSWRLVRGSSGRVFGITLLTEVIVGIASSMIRIPFSLAGGASSFFGGLGAGATSHPAAPSVVATVSSAVGTIISDAVTAPLLAGVLVLLYTDLRMRREGMDIALQAAATQGGHYPAPPAPDPAAPYAPPTPQNTEPQDTTPPAPPPGPW